MVGELKMDVKKKLVELQLRADIEDEVSENTTQHREYIADLMIANGVTVQGWIPVTERLPEVYQPCLCYKRAHGEDGYRLGIYLGASFSEKCAAFKSMSHYGCIGVTHWMPLPPAPEEDAE